LVFATGSGSDDIGVDEPDDEDDVWVSPEKTTFFFGISSLESDTKGGGPADASDSLSSDASAVELGSGRRSASSSASTKN